MTTAPVTTIVADSSGCATCCSMSSTFSTSRTTLVCTMEALVREWKPMDMLCSRAVSPFRRSAPICRTAPMYRFVYCTWLG
ncbi:hypothetical protein SAMN05421867_105128 [Cellulomonas marina]|uniref:Uncharacterized protein n=1 Tax=Cellulomonas marina TaxID=988821 RepID=A0A1I0XN84_9CELL|nr:hypothetical protein SAMN05421867_105128 [Cellulomonas marina]